MPPLRERPEDIEPLARHFLGQAAMQFEREATDFTTDAIDALRRYDWPGNIRELMSVIRRTVVISNGPVIAAKDLNGLGELDRAPSLPPESSRPQPGSEGERLVLVDALARAQENITETARELGVSRVTLYRMLHRHAISLTRGFKNSPGWANTRHRPTDQATSSTG